MSSLCPTCGSAERTRLYQCASFEILQCDVCQLVRKSLDGELSRSRVQQLQDVVYGEIEARLATRSVHEKIAETRLAFLNQFVSGGNILEVGCATGEFLRAALAGGYSVTGLDSSKQYSDYAQRAGLPVRYGRLEDVSFEAGSFSAVAMFHLIEHIEDPPSFLASVATLIAQGGFVLLATPNIRSRTNRIFGYEHPTFHQEDHLFFFSATTLERTLRQAGYTNVTVVSREYPHHVFTSIYGFLARRLRRRYRNPEVETGSSPETHGSISRSRAVMKHLPYTLASVLRPLLRPYTSRNERSGLGHELIAVAEKP